MTPTPRTPETLSFSPSFGRVFALGILVAFPVGIVVLLLVKVPPVVEIMLATTVIAALAIRFLLRMTLVRFDQTENGPWYIRATSTLGGGAITSRVAPRSEIEIVKKYRESGMTSSGTAYGEKYWSEVALTNGQPFFSRWEVFFFGRARLVEEMERFL